MKTESSYLEQVSELYNSIQTDECMPIRDKKNILKLIAQLGDALEKYSY